MRFVWLSRFRRIMQGQSVIEIIVATALFMTIVSGVIPFYLTVFDANQKDIDKLQADLYLQQGLEAVRSIRNQSFSNLVNGTYGLSRTAGYWTLSGSSDLNDKFTRTVVIASAQRDAACNMVASGGTTDTFAKKVTLQVLWDYAPGKPGSTTATQYLTNWPYQAGCEQSSNLEIDMSDVGLSSDDKRVINVRIRNIGNTPIVIDKMTPIWDKIPLIEEIKIGSTIVWKYNNTGTPSGKQPSGVELNIQNYTLPANSNWIDLDHFKYTGDMSDAFLKIYFKMTDGTVRYQEAQLPGDDDD